METESDIIREIVAGDIRRMAEEGGLSEEKASLRRQTGEGYSRREKKPYDGESKPLN